MKNLGKSGHILATVAAASITLSGCATTGGPRTEVDKAFGKCVGTVAGGAILGALISSALGGDAGDGALVGAGVGAGACAVLLVVASEKDRENIRRQQAMAAESLESQVMEYTNEKGRKVRLETQVTEAELPEEFTTMAYERAAALEAQNQTQPSTVTASNMVAPEQRICRRTATTVTLMGSGESTQLGQLVCRTADGDWVPFIEPDQANAFLYRTDKAWS